LKSIVFASETSILVAIFVAALELWFSERIIVCNECYHMETLAATELP